MAGAELNDDMFSIKENTVTVMTPKGGTFEDYAYREGPYVFYRNGIYYFMWSVDDTGSKNYHVAYGTSHSPLDPITVAKEPTYQLFVSRLFFVRNHYCPLKIDGVEN